MKLGTRKQKMWNRVLGCGSLGEKLQVYVPEFLGKQVPVRGWQPAGTDES